MSRRAWAACVLALVAMGSVSLALLDAPDSRAQGVAQAETRDTISRFRCSFIHPFLKSCGAVMFARVGDQMRLVFLHSVGLTPNDAGRDPDSQLAYLPLNRATRSMISKFSEDRAFVWLDDTDPLARKDSPTICFPIIPYLKFPQVEGIWCIRTDGASKQLPNSYWEERGHEFNQLLTPIVMDRAARRKIEVVCLAGMLDPSGESCRGGGWPALLSWLPPLDSPLAWLLGALLMPWLLKFPGAERLILYVAAQYPGPLERFIRAQIRSARQRAEARETYLMQREGHAQGAPRGMTKSQFQAKPDPPELPAAMQSMQPMQPTPPTSREEPLT